MMLLFVEVVVEREWMARDRVHLSTRGVNEVSKLVLHNLDSKN